MKSFCPRTPGKVIGWRPESAPSGFCPAETWLRIQENDLYTPNFLQENPAVNKSNNPGETTPRFEKALIGVIYEVKCSRVPN
jgi:hypothetical protein